MIELLLVYAYLDKGCFLQINKAILASLISEIEMEFSGTSWPNPMSQKSRRSGKALKCSFLD